MRTSGAGGSELRRQGPWPSRSLRRAALVVALAAGVMQMQTSVGAQSVPAPGTTFQARICEVLRSVEASVGANPFVRQALLPWLARFGCPGGQTPTTGVGSSTTTTTIHFDCILPGGGIGPCPTTTITFVPTTFPGGTTVPPPSTTLAPCPSTSTTSTSVPVTTIPCQP